MALTNKEFVEQFANGELPMQTNRMRAQPLEGIPAIIGYDWAVYSVYVKDSVVVFTGWRGYSPTTTKHINLLAEHSDWEIDERPNLGGVVREENLETVRSLAKL